MKKVLLAVFVLAMVPGCLVKPYHVPVLVEIGNSEAAFLIELTGEGQQASFQSEEYLRERMVPTKRIEVPYEWKPESRFLNVGRWIPSARLVVVDRAPETRLWTADRSVGTSAKDEALWVESADSVGFSVGINITARIENEADAVVFLYNYPAQIGQERSQEQVAQATETTYQVAVSSLASIMDTEIKARIQAAMADAAAAYKMDDLRDRKVDIMSTIREDVEPFFKERGITITTIGMFGGFHYENPRIQESIDEVFQAQQDRQVAVAEAAAAEERKRALQLKGEGEAEQRIEVARGEAESIRVVAEAMAFELEQLNVNPQAYLLLKQLEVERDRIEQWDGRYPLYLMSSEFEPNFMMQMPNLDAVNPYPVSQSTDAH